MPNLCLHFARQEGNKGTHRKENHATKVMKLPRTTRRKYETNETIMISKFSRSCKKEIAFVIYESPQMIKGSSSFMHHQIQSERSICPGKIGEEGYSCGDEIIYCIAEK